MGLGLELRLLGRRRRLSTRRWTGDSRPPHRLDGSKITAMLSRSYLSSIGAQRIDLPLTLMDFAKNRSLLIRAVLITPKGVGNNPNGMANGPGDTNRVGNINSVGNTANGIDGNTANGIVGNNANRIESIPLLQRLRE